MAKKLNVFQKHQVAIARKTLRMTDVGARIMGGMSKAEARRILKRLKICKFGLNERTGKCLKRPRKRRR